MNILADQEFALNREHVRKTVQMIEDALNYSIINVLSFNKSEGLIRVG
jgi:hypothetical protein